MNKNQNENKNKGINEPDLLIPREAPKQRCPVCSEVIETRGDVCPACRHYLGEKSTARYQPLSRRTRWTWKIILGIIAVGLTAWIMRESLVACFGG